MQNFYGNKRNRNKNIGSKRSSSDFVLIPAGSFRMGIGNKMCGSNYIEVEKPFYMGRYLVTQEEWVAIMEGNPSRFIGDKRPVERVSWAMVQAFIRRKNMESENAVFRLPSEAEWEYACRAGTETGFSFGSSFWNLGEYAWFSGCLSIEERRNMENSEEDKLCTHSIGQKKPNPWGLYDMHGNVCEWTQDKWRLKLPESIKPWEGNPHVTARVVRGGSFSDIPINCESSFRRALKEGKYDFVGFRLVMKTLP